MSGKLIKVTAGTYRTDDGGYHVFRNPSCDRHSLKRWMVRYTNFFGERVTKYFYSLSECKKYVAGE